VYLCIYIDLAAPIIIQSYRSLVVTISHFQVEFIVNFRVLPNSRNGVYAHTNRLKSRNESVNSASHKHSISLRVQGHADLLLLRIAGWPLSLPGVSNWRELWIVHLPSCPHTQQNSFYEMLQPRAEFFYHFPPEHLFLMSNVLVMPLFNACVGCCAPQ